MYILPNAFTTAALFFGFSAILQSLGGQFGQAAFSVLIAAALDACDGRVARWTHTESKFGVEYDSLADAISFGAAPAIMLYQWQLAELGGGVGVAFAFFYCAATAIRLARFNTQTSQSDKRFFTGIPCPAAAVLVVSLVVCADDFGARPPALLTALFAAFVAISMISRIQFYSFKDINFKRAVNFRTTAAALLIFVVGLNLLTNNVMYLLSLMGLAYLLSGYILYIRGAISRRRQQTHR